MPLRLIESGTGCGLLNESEAEAAPEAAAVAAIHDYVFSAELVALSLGHLMAKPLVAVAVAVVAVAVVMVVAVVGLLLFTGAETIQLLEPEMFLARIETQFNSCTR